MAIGLENVTSRKTKKTAKVSTPIPSTNAAVEAAPLRDAKKVVASRPERVSQKTFAEESAAIDETWLSFLNAVTGSESANRALGFCRALMNIEQETFRFVVGQLSKLDLAQNTKGRTIWSRPLSRIVERLSY